MERDGGIAPERDTNNKMLGLLGAGHGVTDIDQGALAIILTVVQPLFVLSQLQVGLVVLAFNVSSSVIQPLFGIFSDRFRAAWLIPSGCLLAGLGMALTGLSRDYRSLLLAVLVSGLGVAAYHPEGSKFARLFSGLRKATGMSIFSVGGNLGFAVGPLLASLFYALLGLPGTLGFLAINGAMATVLWASLPKLTAADPPAALPPVAQVARSTAAPAARSKIADRRNRDSAFDSGGSPTPRLVAVVVLLVLVVSIRSWINLGVVTFLPQYYVHYLHKNQLLAAVATSIFLFAGAFGTLVGGPAADRWGFKTVIVVSLAALLPLLYLITATGGFWTVAIIAVAGFFVLSTFAVTVVFGQELLPQNVGLASGLMLGFSVGMGGVGTTILGWVADHHGLPAVFTAMLLFSALGLLAALFLPGRQEMKRVEEN